MIGHHVSRHSGFMFTCLSGNVRLRERAVEGLAPGAGGLGELRLPFASPRKQGILREQAPSDPRIQIVR